MNTSLPRMFSLKRTETSPSSKRVTTASPTGTLRRLQIASVSLWLDVPEKMRQGSTADLRCAAGHALATCANARRRRARPWTRWNDDGMWRSDSRGRIHPAPAKMAGAGGFEPPYAGAKVPCLTAWPRPTNERGFRHGPPSAQVHGGVKAAGPENSRVG